MFQNLANSEGVGLQGLDDLTWNDPHINQPCGEIFFLWAKLCDHDGVKNTSWSPDIKLILE